MQTTEIQPEKAVKFIKSIIDSISDIEMRNLLDDKISNYFDTNQGQGLYAVLSGVKNAMTERNPIKGESDLKQLFFECKTINRHQTTEVATEKGLVTTNNSSLSYVSTIRLLLAIYCPQEYNPIFTDFFDKLDPRATIRERIIDEVVAEGLKDIITKLHRDERFTLPEQYLKAQKDSNPNIADLSSEAPVDLSVVSGPSLKEVGIVPQVKKKKGRVKTQRNSSDEIEREPKIDRQVVSLDESIKNEVKNKLGQILKIFQDYDSVDIFSDREALLNLTLKINGLFESLERVQTPAYVIKKLRKELNSFSVSKVWEFCSRNKEETVSLPFGIRTAMTSIKKNLEAILKSPPNWLK